MEELLESTVTKDVWLYARDLGLNKIDIGKINTWRLEKIKFNKKKLTSTMTIILKKIL